MKTNKFLAFALAGTMGFASCQKSDLGQDNLDTQNAVAYTAVTENPTTKIINTAVLDPAGATFDSHQAWFDFTTISSSQKGHASPRNAWNLQFWSNNGSLKVNGANSSSFVGLNYSLNTQAKLITGVTTLATNLPTQQKTQLDAALALFDGGPVGMGDLSTFDFHKENQFVIGTPTTTNRVYLMRTPAVQVHPDTTGGNTPVTATLFLVAVKATTTGYSVQFRAVENTGSTWAWSVPSATTVNVPKSSSYQYRYVSFGETAVNDNIQPAIGSWNLGLSAVVLKRYMNPDFGGGSYPFALKGVVLNNNPNVKVYAVQKNTGSTAGAPGPYDPNYTWQNDPALNTANDITTDFNNFKAANIVDSKFKSDSQEEIGQYWRYLDMGNYKVFVDRFYVIKLQNGDVYKLKFSKIGTGTSTPVNNGIQITYAKIAKS